MTNNCKWRFNICWYFHFLKREVRYDFPAHVGEYVAQELITITTRRWCFKPELHFMTDSLHKAGLWCHYTKWSCLRTLGPAPAPLTVSMVATLDSPVSRLSSTSAILLLPWKDLGSEEERKSSIVTLLRETRVAVQKFWRTVQWINMNFWLASFFVDNIEENKCSDQKLRNAIFVRFESRLIIVSRNYNCRDIWF